MGDPSPAGIDVRHYLTVVRRHILLIAVHRDRARRRRVRLLGLQDADYEATAQLLYVPQLDITNPLNQGFIDPTAQELQMQSAVTTITAPADRPAVATQIGRPRQCARALGLRRHHHLRRRCPAPRPTTASR